MEFNSKCSQAKSTRFFPLWKNPNYKNICAVKLSTCYQWEAPLCSQPSFLQQPWYSPEARWLFWNPWSFWFELHSGYSLRRSCLLCCICTPNKSPWFYWGCFPKQWEASPILAPWRIRFLGSWVSHNAHHLIQVWWKKKGKQKRPLLITSLTPSKNYRYGSGQWTDASRSKYNLVDALTRHTVQVVNLTTKDFQIQCKNLINSPIKICGIK